MVSFCHQAINTPPSLHSIQCVQFIIANQDVLLVVQLEYSRHLFSVPSSPILDLSHYTCVIAAACYSSSLLFSFFVAAMGGGKGGGHDWKVVHKGGGKGGGKGEGKLKGRGVAPQGVAPHGPVSAGAAPFEVGDDFGSLPLASTKYMNHYVTWPRFASSKAAPPTLVYHPLHHGVSPVAAAVWIAPIDALIYGSEWLKVVQANVCNSTCINPMCCSLHSCSYSKFPSTLFLWLYSLYMLVGCRSSKFEV